MVCKEELCSWFKTLSPHKRIDFMCGMLQICLPMELRFMGSYVEDLAKKDFHHLRDAEVKANSRAELSKLNELDDKIFRTKMAIYLGLMHSSNRTCSSIIYTLLEENMNRAFTVFKNMDNITIHHILLVLSMAMNHPAFSYNQKAQMYEYYKKAVDVAFGLFDEPEPDIFPTLILAEACETRSCDQHLSPACSPQAMSTSPTQSAKVHVCNIELKGSRMRDRDEQILEYRIQVTWSNGEKREVYKTYQDLADFHNMLVHLFPEETNSLKQQINVFNNQGVPNHKDETQEQLSLYSRYISGLPQHVLECGFITSYFSAVSGPTVRTSADASTSPRPQSVVDMPTLNYLANSGDEEASVIHYYPSKEGPVPTHLMPQSPMHGDGGSLSPHSPAHHELVYSSSLHSPSCSTKTSSPLISSPCPSPTSSRTDSPLNSRSSSPASHNATFSGIATLLNHLQLGRYADNLSKHSLEQLSSMRNEDIESLGIPMECVLKIKSFLETPRERICHIPNGLLGPPQPMMWPPPQPTHTPYLPPHPGAPLAFPHQGPPLFPFAHIMGYTYPPTASSGIRDMSPTNSECSSPSPHPVPQLQLTDSSSDDNEKGRQINPRWKGHIASTVNCEVNCHNNIPSDGKSVVNMNGDSLPRNLDSTSETNMLNGSHTNSGYTSDPTYNAHHQPLIHPPLTAQPAHTHMAAHPSHVISMPDSYVRPAAPYVPMVIPAPITMATSVTGSHGYGMATDVGQRKVLYLPSDPATLNRSHMYNNNGNHPLYANGAIPATNQSFNNLHHANANGNKAYQGPPGAIPRGNSIPPLPQTNGVDGSENGKNPPVVEIGAQRAGLMPTPPTSSAPVTMTTSGHSMQSKSVTSRPTCTSCGCPGHVTNNTMPYGFPHMAPNFWPSPYANGLIPFPMQHMYLQPTPLPNGFAPELMYSHPYRLHHSVGQGMAAGVPSHVLHGYNHCTPQPVETHSKPKKSNCHNCGSSKHQAADCMEVSMDAMSGHFHYTYKPKNESD